MDVVWRCNGVAVDFYLNGIHPPYQQTAAPANLDLELKLNSLVSQRSHIDTSQVNDLLEKFSA